MAEEKICPCVPLQNAQKEIDDQRKGNTERDINYVRLEEKLVHVVAKVDEIHTDVKCMKDKPAKKWDGFTANILNWATVAILGYIAAQIAR